MIKKIDHLGIAARDGGLHRDVYERILGFRLHDAETVASQNVRASFYPCAGVNFELLESTSPDGTIARFLEKRGEGFHHVAFEVDDIRGELARVKALGVQLIDEAPRAGAHGSLVAFLHPRSTRGVLVEFVEHPRRG